jgi:hypothetical protein
MRRFFAGLLLVIALCGGCASILPTVAEEAADPESPPRKIAAHQIRRWTSKPISRFEKQFDYNHNGLLEPEELARLRMARGFFQQYGNVWKYDKNHDWRLDNEEYYDASGGDQ